MTKKNIFFITLIAISNLFAQNDPKEFTYTEFLGYVKKHHPLALKAQLKISEAQAKLMKARGAFDPKLEAEFNQKEFGDKKYYSLFNGSFKIPTWYGIEIKAAFDNNEGIYLNPENNTSYNGLTSLGVSIPLGQELFINQRMADLKKAKVYQNLNEAERKIAITDLIYEATLSYLKWKRSHQEVEMYTRYLTNASVRYQGVLKLIEEGDKAGIDSIEAGITVKTRKLNLENAQLKLNKARLELSVFLWSDQQIPLELTPDLHPDLNLEISLKENLSSNISIENLDNHPKLQSLQSKIKLLEIDKKIAENKILPQLRVNYNYLSEPDLFNNYRLEDYKLGISFAFPLFLRKERAELKLSKIKLQETSLGFDFEKIQLKNKIQAKQLEINSYEKQFIINSELVINYEQMLQAEERLYQIGESSLFLINSRENKLVSAQLSNISLQNTLWESLTELFKAFSQPE